MQFKGSLRSPGDRGPGIRVSLEVDEYHLQIRRGTELMGRWYLADVEVVRDIAERFTLFLGDDEMEFLADDALVFAYDGVTRMQTGWVNAQKKKRRHRRAAAEAARRKDEAPDEEDIGPAQIEEERRQPTRAAAKAPSSELAKKLAAIAAAEDAELNFPAAERFPREKPGEAPEPPLEVDWIAAREEMAIGREEPVSTVEPAANDGRLKRRKPEKREPEKPEPAPASASPDLWVEVEPAVPRPEPEPARPAARLPKPQEPEPQLPKPQQPEPELPEPELQEPQWFEVTESVPWAEPAWLTPTEVGDASAAASEEWAEPSWIAPNTSEAQTASVPPAVSATQTQAQSDLRRRFEALEHAARDESFSEGRDDPKAKKRRTKTEKVERVDKAEKGKRTARDGAGGHYPDRKALPTRARAEPFEAGQVEAG